MVNEVPNLIGVGIEALLQNAGRLGLTWSLNLATVAEVPTALNPATMCIYDGDSASIGMTSMIGYLPIGARVWVIKVPPSGNYIVGTTDLTNVLPSATTAVIEAPSGTTTSSSFADFPGSPTLELTKRYPRGASQLLFTVIGTAWANDVPPNTGQIQLGVTVEGTDWALNFLNYNTLSSHLTWGGQRQIDADPGLASYPLRWRRPGGTATITVDSADWVSFSVLEVPIF